MEKTTQIIKKLAELVEQLSKLTIKTIEIILLTKILIDLLF